jgi:hypothetical protein
MFDCGSAQFLAIEEALNDSNRRIAMPAPAGGEFDYEMLDVVVELLFAAEYLANGGLAPVPGNGGSTAGTNTSQELKSKTPVNDGMFNFRALVLGNKTQIQMAINGSKFFFLIEFF